MFPDFTKLEKALVALLAVQEAQLTFLSEIAANTFQGSPEELKAITDNMARMKTTVRRVIDDARK